MTDNQPIIIAGKNVKDYLQTIGLRGLTEDEITLHFNDKHSGTAEYLLRILRKSFGWEERERSKVETQNMKCVYDELDLTECKKCGNKRMVRKCAHPDLKVPGGCQEGMRTKCKGWKKKYNNTFTVNEVIIEKLPQMRT